MSTNVKTYRKPAPMYRRDGNRKQVASFPLMFSKGLQFWFMSGYPVPAYSVHKMGDDLEWRKFWVGKNRWSRQVNKGVEKF